MNAVARAARVSLTALLPACAAVFATHASAADTSRDLHQALMRPRELGVELRYSFR